MNGFIKPAIATLAVASVVIAPVSQAFAHERWKHHKHRPYHQPVIVKKNDPGELIAAGIIGLAVGAIIVGAATQGSGHKTHVPHRPRPDRNYFPPRPDEIDDEPEIIYAEPAFDAPQPWSPEWYDYCNNRYRSFDDRSGTFLGYDGKRHFCVAD